MRIRSLQRLLQVVRIMSRHAVDQLRQQRGTLAVGMAAVATVAVLCLPIDRPFSRWIEANQNQGLYELAKDIRVWGDFVDTVVIATSVYLVGLWSGRRRLQLAAIACFTAAVMSGLTANIVRFSAGRPRPNTELPDRLYGPTFNYRMQSFPSGHCSTSTGNAVAMAVAFPPLAAPVLISSGSIAWASVYTRRHHLSDVVVGIGWGAAFGMLYGCAARRLARRLGGRAEEPVLGARLFARVGLSRHDRLHPGTSVSRSRTARSARTGPAASGNAVAPSH